MSNDKNTKHEGQSGPFRRDDYPVGQALTREDVAEMQGQIRSLAEQVGALAGQMVADRDAAQLEVERLTKMLDVCAVTHDHNVKLKAEVARLKAELQAEKNSATESIGAWQITAGEWGAKCHHLQAEVERLKGELERQRILHNECAQCGASLYDCTEPPHCEGCVIDEDKLVEWVAATATDSARLRAHTWQQDRADVVAWLRDEADPWCGGSEGAYRLAEQVETGEHWPEGGKE